MRALLFSALAATITVGAAPAMACDEGDLAEVAATICGTIVGDAVAGPVGALIVGTRAAEAARGGHNEYHRQIDVAPVPELAPIPDMQLRRTFGEGGGGVSRQLLQIPQLELNDPEKALLSPLREQGGDGLSRTQPCGDVRSTPLDQLQRGGQVASEVARQQGLVMGDPVADVSDPFDPGSNLPSGGLHGHLREEAGEDLTQVSVPQHRVLGRDEKVLPEHELDVRHDTVGMGMPLRERPEVVAHPVGRDSWP